MDIEQLKSLLVVAKHNHFTEASYEASLSQSALSKHIRKLEKTLGDIQIFERSHNKVKLTAVGQEVVTRASRIIAEFEDLQFIVKEYSNLNKGHLIVGTIPVLGRVGLTPLIASFQRKYPGITIEFQERDSKELTDLLNQSKIDVAIIALPKENHEAKNIKTYTLLEDEVVFITDTSHPFSKKNTISLEEAASQPFILLHPTSNIHTIVINACRTSGFSPIIVYESTYIDTIVGLVAERLGVSLLGLKTIIGINKNIAVIKVNTPILYTISVAVSRQSQTLSSVSAFIKHSLEWKKYNI